MPNQRAEGQKLLPVMASEEFIQALDASLPRAGYSNRSQFVRDAILEKLMRAGIAVPADLSLSPSRTKPAYALVEKAYALNDKPSSTPASKVAQAVAAAVNHSKQKARRRKPRP